MSLARARRDHDWDLSRRWPALGLILALHASALWGLMQIDSFRTAVVQAAPIMVGLVSVAPPALPPPEPQPPEPRKVEPKPKPKPQVIAADLATPALIEAPPPEPVVIQAPVPAAPPQGEPAPLPTIPPSFVAEYLDNPAPRYPPSSKRLGESGLVMLRVRVNAEGLPESIEIEKSCGYSRLDRAALDAVRRWKFVPARQGDHAVPATVLVPLNFELQPA